MIQCVKWEPLFSQLILCTQRSWFELVLGSQRKPSPIVTEMLQDWTNIHASPLDSPPVWQVECYPLWLEPILAADSRRLRLQQVIRCHSSSNKPSFSPSSIFCVGMQDKKHNRGQGWTQTIYYNKYEEDTLGMPPMELTRDIPYLLGAWTDEEGVTRRPSCTYCLIAYTKHPCTAPMYP